MMDKTIRRIIVSLLIVIMTAASVPSVAFAYPEGYAETQYKIGKAMYESMKQEAVNPSSPHAAATYNAVIKGGAYVYNRNSRYAAYTQFEKALHKQQSLYRWNKAGTVMKQTAGYKKAAKAVTAAEKNYWKVVKSEAKVCKVGGAAVSGYCIYERGKTYLSEKHNHSSIEFLNRTMKGIDITTNLVSIVDKEAALASIGTGYAADFTDSDGFVELANSWDNWFINGLDLTVDDMNDAVYNFFLKYFFSNYRPAQGVGVYKPNIYIYPGEETDVTVKFAVPGLLTSVIPDYAGSWSVTAQPSGRLTDANGACYDYLFYEMDIQPQVVPLGSAFIVPADSRTEVFTEMLKGYGLNEKEIADFCDFWADKLESGKTYLAYEVLTEDVDALMPISVSPAPDSVLRLWFFFVEYEGQDFVQAQPAAFERDGFTIVEWGGILK